MDHIEAFVKKHYYPVLFAMAGISTVFFLILVGREYITGDEAYTMGMIRRSFADIWKITAADVHPPLYYFILKIFAAPFSYSFMAAKVFSVITYVFIMIFGGLQLGKLFGKKAGLIFIPAFVLFPFVLSFSVEARMYSLAAAFVLAEAVFAYKGWLYGKKADFILTAVCAAGASYTHYFSLVSAGFIYLLLLIAILWKKREQIKIWLISLAVIIVLYLPWAKEFVSQLVYKVENEYWIGPIGGSTLLTFFKTLFGSEGVSLFEFFFLTVFLVLFVLLILKADKKIFIICLCAALVPFLTLVTGVAVSVLIRPVFVIRYIMPAVPLLSAYLAIALGHLKSRELLSAVLTLLLVGGISNYYEVFQSEYTYRKNELDKAFVEEYSDCDAFITTNGTAAFFRILGYLAPDKDVYSNKIALSASPHENVHSLKSFDPEKNETVLYISSTGEKPLKKIRKAYDAEYIGTVNENQHQGDVYLLKRK